MDNFGHLGSIDPIKVTDSSSEIAGNAKANPEVYDSAAQLRPSDATTDAPKEEGPLESYTFRTSVADLKRIHRNNGSSLVRLIEFVLTVALSLLVMSEWDSTGSIIGTIPYIAVAVGFYALFKWILIRSAREQIKKAEGAVDTLEIYPDHIRYYVSRDGVLRRFFRVMPSEVVSVKYDKILFSFIADGIIYSIPVREISEKSALFDLIRPPVVKGARARDVREKCDLGAGASLFMWVLIDLSVSGLLLRGLLAAFSVWMPVLLTLLPLLLLSAVLIYRARGREVGTLFFAVAVVLTAVYLATDLIYLTEYFIGLIA